MWLFFWSASLIMGWGGQEKHRDIGVDLRWYSVSSPKKKSRLTSFLEKTWRVVIVFWREPIGKTNQSARRCRQTPGNLRMFLYVCVWRQIEARWDRLLVRFRGVRTSPTLFSFNLNTDDVYRILFYDAVFISATHWQAPIPFPVKVLLELADGTAADHT